VYESVREGERGRQRGGGWRERKKESVRGERGREREEGRGVS
jgi:hypothetical protein